MDSFKVILYLTTLFMEIFFGVIFFFLFQRLFAIQIVGFYGVAISFFNLFIFIIDAGFSVAHLKFYAQAKNKEEQEQCNGTFLVYRILLLIVYVIVIAILIPFYTPFQGNYSKIYSLFFIVLLNKIGFIFRPLYLMNKKVIKIGIPMIVCELLKISLLLLLIDFIEATFNLLLIILFVSYFIQFLLNLLLLRNLKFKTPSIFYLKKYLTFSLPLIAIVAFSTFLNYIDVIMVNLWFPIEQVANFYSAKVFYLYFLLFNTALINILISSFSKNISNGKNEINLKIINQTHKITNLIVVPLVFLIVLFSSDVIIFLLGSNYRYVGIYLSILSFSLIITSLNCVIYIQLNALGEVNFLAKLSFLGGFLELVLLYMFISPNYFNMGAFGAALGLVLSQIIIEIISRPIIYKKYGLGFYWGSFRNLLIMFFVFLIQLYLNSIIRVSIFLIPLFSLIDISVYFIINYLLKGISKEDIKFIIGLMSIKTFKNQILSEFENQSPLKD